MAWAGGVGWHADRKQLRSTSAARWQYNCTIFGGGRGIFHPLSLDPRPVMPTWLEEERPRRVIGAPAMHIISVIVMVVEVDVVVVVKNFMVSLAVCVETWRYGNSERLGYIEQAGRAYCQSSGIVKVS